MLFADRIDQIGSGTPLRPTYFDERIESGGERFRADSTAAVSTYLGLFPGSARLARFL
jgi:hypothetical protein